MGDSCHSGGFCCYWIKHPDLTTLDNLFSPLLIVIVQCAVHSSEAWCLHLLLLYSYSVENVEIKSPASAFRMIMFWGEADSK